MPKNHSLVEDLVLPIFAPDDANSQIAKSEAKGECFAPFLLREIMKIDGLENNSRAFK